MRKRSNLLLSLLAGAGLLASPVEGAAANYVYILTGQSNSLGAVKGTPATAEQLERYSSEGLLWSGNMERDSGRPFEASPSWQTVAPQLPAYNGSLCMGPEYGFAHMMQRRGWHSTAGDKVCIIKASLDGGGNSFWLPGRPAWLTLTGTVKEGLAALKGKSQVRALLYLQGESDKGEEIAAAPARLLDLRARLQKEVKRGLKYAVVGECATWGGREEKDAKGNTSAGLMHALSQKKKDIGWVRTRDLSKITSGDNMGVHYDGKSQITIGARYAYAVAEQERLLQQSVRGDAPDAPLDAPAAWWGGMVPGVADVATWDISSFRGKDTLSKGLSVAGLLVEDPSAGGVSLSAAKGKRVTLQVGADGIVLQEGDLSLALTLQTTQAQSWVLAEGRTLKLTGTLVGKGCITLKASASATLELELSAAPEQEWLLPEGEPQLRASIAGKPAHFVKHGSVYKLEPRGS